MDWIRTRLAQAGRWLDNTLLRDTQKLVVTVFAVGGACAGIGGWCSPANWHVASSVAVAFTGFGLAAVYNGAGRDRRQFQSVVRVPVLGRAVVTALGVASGTCVLLMSRCDHLTLANVLTTCSLISVILFALCLKADGDLQAYKLQNKLNAYIARVAPIYYSDEGVGDADAAGRLVPGMYMVRADDGSLFPIDPDEF